MNGLAQVVGSLLMYGIGKNGSISLASWRVLFLVCGALTTVSGVLFMLWIPTNPDSAWFFTGKEKIIIAERMATDRESGDQTNFSMSQAKEALTDIRAIFVFFFGVLVTMQSPVLTVSCQIPGLLSKRLIASVCVSYNKKSSLRQVSDYAVHSTIWRRADSFYLACDTWVSAAAKQEMSHRHHSFNAASRREPASFKTSHFVWLGNDRIVLAGKQQITMARWRKWYPC